MRKVLGSIPVGNILLFFFHLVRNGISVNTPENILLNLKYLFAFMVFHRTHTTQVVHVFRYFTGPHDRSYIKLPGLGKWEHNGRNIKWEREWWRNRGWRFYWFICFRYVHMSRDSAVGITTSYWLDDRGVGFRVQGGSRIFTSPCRLDRLWGLLNLISNGYRRLFPGGKAVGAWSRSLASN
jgi:hypothetical protein